MDREPTRFTSRETWSGESDGYSLNMSTQDKREAGRLLHAAGFVDRVAGKRDDVPWRSFAFVASAGIIAAGGVLGLLSRDRVLAEWAITATKAALIAGGLTGAGAMLTAAYDALHARWRADQDAQLDLETRRVDLTRHKMESKIVVLRPDEWGRRGVAYDGTTYRDLDTKAAYTQAVTLALSPIMEQLNIMLEAQRAMARALPPTTYHNEQIVGDQVTPDAQLTEGEAQAPTWDVYPIGRLLGGREPSLNSLILGAYPTSEGVKTIERSLDELMHVLCVGASGWGKSTWLRAFLYQIARAQEPVEVVAIDTSGSALNALRGWGKLRYPVAREANDAAAVLTQVSEEIDRRRKMYEQHPRAENLREYNAASGQNMPPWVIVADESTHLLHTPGMGEYLRELVQTGRQYGMYGFVAGQTAKATVIDSEIRDQFSSRLCFHTSPPSSRTVLDDRAASFLRDKGRLYGQLVGTEVFEIQGPWVTKDELIKALSNGGPRHDMPVYVASEATEPSGNGNGHKALLVDDPANIARVRELRAAGASDTAIAREVFGHGTTFYIDRVRAILEQHNESNESEADSTPQNEGSERDCRYVVDGDQVHEARDFDFCDFCRRDGDSMPDGVLFATCPSCGVAICSDCLADSGGVCPDCADGAS